MARLSGVTSRQAIRVVSVIGFLVAPALVAAALVGPTAAATTFTYGYGPTPMVSSIEPMLIRELPAASRARVSPRNLDEEIATLNGRRCIGAAGRPLERCDHRSGEGAVTVAVVGDSKMHQWLPALEALAGVQSIELVSLLVSGCPFVAVRTLRDGRFDQACAWSNIERRRILAHLDVDVILVSQRASEAFAPPGSARSRAEMMEDELVRQWRAWSGSGRRVVVMLDNPAPPDDIPTCLGLIAAGVGRDCGFDRDAATAASAAVVQRRAAARVPEVSVIDPAAWVCDDRRCRATRGGRSLYRQGSHLAASAVLDLAPRLVDEMATMLLRGVSVGAGHGAVKNMTD